MGKVYALSCNQCGYENTVSVGGGMMSKNPDMISHSLRGEDLEIWQQLLGSQQIQDFSGVKNLTYCKTCGKLEAVFQVEIEKKDGETVLLGSACETCGQELQSINEEGIISCPKCHIPLKKEMQGLWD